MKLRILNFTYLEVRNFKEGKIEDVSVDEQGKGNEYSDHSGNKPSEGMLLLFKQPVIDIKLLGFLFDIKAEFTNPFIDLQDHSFLAC